ncbi:RNA polymerase sigma factor [Nonomuraea sp. NPDC050783]|uniref:RNA polymerase sigma factor n=1 Tax=Nonomuraea sp. NPDC050783 TaxID=3154634 RepID=UPI0034676C24
MWRTLSDDARQAIRDLCDRHGARLYDYCRTELAAGEAEQAVAGALLTAHLYADRLADPALRRPWLYALARAHRAVVARPASIGSWSRPGRMSELLPEALLSLQRPQRELLDLSLRHGLSDAELAVLFELDAAEVRAIVARAAAGLEEWFAAIVAARGTGGCADLTARVSAWVAAPGRRARARIGRHIQSCATCRAAPRTMTAGALLRRLPITTLPGTLPNRLASAQPLPAEGHLWRADGFPVQARTLVETGPAETGHWAAVPPVADATPAVPVADPTTATQGKPWPVAGAAATGQELPAAPAVRGRHPFAPQSRARAVRGGAYTDKLVYSATPGNGTGDDHAISPDAIIRYGGITMSGDPPGGERRWQEYWKEPPGDDAEAGTPIRAVARLALVLGVGLLAAGLVWALLNARDHPTVITKTAARTSVLPERPAGWVARAPVPPAGRAGLTSVTRTVTLPRPAPPVARLSPASVSLGSARAGSFALACSGRCTITSVTATPGLAVSGTRFRVRESAARAGCGDQGRSGRIVVRWAGTATGDGVRTGGTTATRGTLALTVHWTAGRDWSSCA